MALVSLVGKGCHIELVLGIFLLFDLVQKYFQMELGRSSNKGIFYGQTDHTGRAWVSPSVLTVSKFENFDPFFFNLIL